VANRAYLLAVDDRSVTLSEDPATEILAEGIGEIPLFWASLFVSGDRQIDRYDGEDGEGEHVDVEIPNWCTEAAVAKERLQLLRMPIAKLLDEQSRSVWEQWVDFPLDQKSGYFKTDAAEVWDLHDPEAYEGYWSDLLRAFSDPSAATLEAALDRIELRYNKGRVSCIWDDKTNDNDVTLCKLAGAEHIRDLPWFK
jgi:hypothetical protein